jgi:hypothetical protein
VDQAAAPRQRTNAEGELARTNQQTAPCRPTAERPQGRWLGDETWGPLSDRHRQKQRPEPATGAAANRPCRWRLRRCRGGHSMRPYSRLFGGGSAALDYVQFRHVPSGCLAPNGHVTSKVQPFVANAR